MDTGFLGSLDSQGKQKFSSILNAFQGDVSLAAARLSIDPLLRLEYSKRIKLMSDELKAKADIGLITWDQAAKEAQDMRFLIMEMIKSCNTPLGKSMAEKLKLSGKTFNELVAKKTVLLFGRQANFNSLSEVQKHRVYADIVESAGRSNAKVNLAMARLSAVGKGLIVLSIAISVYEIYNASNKVTEATKQMSILGTGVAGGWAGGAMAGLVCGPGAPVCVLIGSFVGGALAAWQIGRLWR